MKNGNDVRFDFQLKTCNGLQFTHRTPKTFIVPRGVGV